MNKSQLEFFQIIKNCHRVDPPFKVLMWISWLIDAEVVEEEKTFYIYKDSSILFVGDYEQLLDNLFEYIFKGENNE